MGAPIPVAEPASAYTNMADQLPATMKAAQWSTTAGGIEKNLKVNPKALLPKTAKNLPKDSTLVKVHYSTVNPVDYKMPEAPLVGNYLFSRPAIPCGDFAGTVVTSSLPHLKPGELVFGKTEPPTFNALAEYMIVNKMGIAPIPDGVSFQDTVGVGVCGLTAYQCIVPFTKPGSKVFINGGSGGTGTFGIQIAKAYGCTVTTTCSGPNVELCKSLGADEVIDYRTQDVVEHLKRSGTQYDLLVDNVNTPALYWNAHHYLKPDSKYITISGDFDFANIRNMLAMFLLPKWLGGGQRTPQFVVCSNQPEHLAHIAKWIKEGKVKTIVEKVYELEEAGEAFARLKTGRVRGKLLVKVAGE